MELYRKIDECLGKIAPIAFIILTFYVCLNRIPFYDEAHSFLISQFSLKEIFYLARVEGHPILWYLIIKPFNNIDWYPYPMILINWFFMMCAMIIFWKKAPFNNLIKFLISFSFPIFQYYAIVARPYGFGVLLLFLLSLLYEKSIQKPVLYSFLLVLCANTSVIACLSSVGFGLIFLYRIFKEKVLSKKQLLFVAIVLFLGAFFLCIQFWKLQMPEVDIDSAKKDLFKYFLYFVVNPFVDFNKKHIIHIALEFISLIMFYYVPFVLFKKDKKALVVLLASVLLISCFFLNVYPGNYWHYYFIFVLLICTFWICWKKIKNIKYLSILFISLLLVNMSSYSIANNENTPLLESSIYRKILSTILVKKELKNAKLFCFDYYTPIAPGIVPYLKRNGIFLYDSHGNDRSSFENIKNISKYTYRSFVPSEFINYLEKDKDNLLLTELRNKKEYQDFFINDENYIIYFDIIEKYPEVHFAIFKIRVEKVK